MQDVVSVTIVGSSISSLRLNAHRLLMCLALLSAALSGALFVRSQFVSPRRIISLPSLSKQESTSSILLKESAG